MHAARRIFSDQLLCLKVLKASSQALMYAEILQLLTCVILALEICPCAITEYKSKSIVQFVLVNNLEWAIVMHQSATPLHIGELYMV